MNTNQQKEVWQMTRKEFTDGKTGDALAVFRAAHAIHVREAVAEGKNVSADVLANYKHNGWATQ